jgi:uncharacterized RDD family membrane protein YckC
MKQERVVVLLRLCAFSVDWLLIALWGGALFGVVMFASGGSPPRPDSPWQAQGIGFVTMTLPVVLYFAVCESSVMRASVGKRVLGLVVTDETGARLSFRSAFLRNAIKFAPWEFGHTVAQQAVFSGEAGFATWVWVPAAIAFICPVLWVAGIVVRGRAPYDDLARTRVGRPAARPGR